MSALPYQHDYMNRVVNVNMIDVNTLCDTRQMESSAARLKHAREAAGFPSAMSAAKRHRWGTSTYAAHENGQNGFDAETALKYAKALKASASWILTGEGDPPARQEPARLVRSFDPDDPERNPDTNSAETETQMFPGDAIKELAAKGGMGAGQVISTSYTRDGIEITAQDAVKEEYWKFPSSFVRNTLGTQVASLIAVECRGDSMEPTLKAGERVWVDTAHLRPSPDGVYAIRDPLDEIVVKRLEITDDKPPRVAVLSDNPGHTRRVYDLDEVVVIGKVVCSLRLF